ncbi:hypothetical protein F2Q68_00025546 [Brassica cretica]|uniref:Uncharacterized protein n=1 Tax=Brassica cretica TaxID=69181 RepID=A0A8S9II20_BRACR|nr:hypothetical protein F2Q68_00025546 [Brassica cretica]
MFDHRSLEPPSPAAVRPPPHRCRLSAAAGDFSSKTPPLLLPPVTGAGDSANSAESTR